MIQEEQLRLEMLVILLTKVDKDLLPKKEEYLDETKLITMADKLVDYVLKGREGKLKLI